MAKTLAQLQAYRKAWRQNRRKEVKRVRGTKVLCKGCGVKVDNYNVTGYCQGCRNETRLRRSRKCKDCGNLISGGSISGWCYKCCKKGERNIHYGVPHSKETLAKIWSKIKDKVRKGSDHPRWVGGGTNDYPSEFSQRLKDKIKRRDRNRCCNCGITQVEHRKKYGKGLQIHHIDFSVNHCYESNLITLCGPCNREASQDRDYWFAFYTYKMEERGLV